MHSLPNQSIFRIFSANDWNQSELSHSKILPSFKNLNPQNPHTIFSNAENLRKIESLDTENNSLESSRTMWSNGLTIPFPIIRGCFNLSTSVR